MATVSLASSFSEAVRDKAVALSQAMDAQTAAFTRKFVDELLSPSLEELLKTLEGLVPRYAGQEVPEIVVVPLPKSIAGATVEMRLKLPERDVTQIFMDEIVLRNFGLSSDRDEKHYLQALAKSLRMEGFDLEYWLKGEGKVAMSLVPRRAGQTET